MHPVINDWIRWAKLPNGTVRIYHPFKCAYFEFEDVSASLFIGIAEGRPHMEVIERICLNLDCQNSKDIVIDEALEFIDKLVGLEIVEYLDV